MVKRLIIAVCLLAMSSALLMPPKMPVLAGDRQPPLPCCVPQQWEGLQHMIMGQVISGQPNLVNVTYRQSYDFSNKKLALELLGSPRTKVIQDYNKMMQYVISGQNCSATKIIGDMFHCIPASATHLQTFYFGGMQGLLMDAWQVTAPGLGGDLVVDVTHDGCIPVAEVITNKEAQSMTVLTYADITMGIRDPKVFNVPSPPCPANNNQTDGALNARFWLSGL
ncbi:ependymin-related protein 2-like [Branchiostoma floridae x Branchiostoma japonicum]